MTAPAARFASNGSDPGRRLHFWCPGCEDVHGIVFDAPNSWTFDGNLERPTISPSILVTSTWGNGKTKDDPAYVETERRCHSFVRDGQIEFLGDCTHALAGQTAPLPPWPYS